MLERIFLNIAPFQKFGTIRADLIEQMRFKQRLKVIQTLEDTTKRNVVRTAVGRWGHLTFTLLAGSPAPALQNLRKNLEAFSVCHVVGL